MTMICAEPQCDRPVEVKRVGLCRRHHRAHWKKGTLPMSDAPVRNRSVSEGNRWCNTCQQEQPEGNFYRHHKDPSGLERICKDCTHLRSAGITREQYEELLERQQGGCAICATVPATRFHVDHDHACCPGRRSCGHCVRGLLCGPCNRALGILDDDTERILACALYLERTHR